MEGEYRKPHPSFRMVLVWMTFSDLFKVTMIQRQITWKWYNIQLYLQWPTNKKSYDLSTGSIFNDLVWPLPLVLRSRRFLTLNISETVRPYHIQIVSMKILIGTNTRRTQQCHFEWSWVTKQNIQWHEASSGLSATAELLVLLHRKHQCKVSYCTCSYTVSYTVSIMLNYFAFFRFYRASAYWRAILI